MPVQHVMNPGQVCVAGMQPSLTPPSECVCSFRQTGCFMAPHCLARYPTKKAYVTLTYNLEIQ